MFLYLAVVVAAVTSVEAAAKVLLVSMDGFRWDYTQKWHTPNFDKMALQGTKAPYLTSTFNTKTFPSHYSIATGLYQESHGIVGNKMFDPVLNASFKIGTWGQKWWDRGEPIWATVRKQGLKSAVFFWPGSEARVTENSPNEYRKYNWRVPFEERVDTVVEWLNKSDMDLAVTYFNEPDRTGHIFGPNAKETEEKVISMDALLGYLVEKLESAQLFDTVNLIVTSDHGMAEVDYKQKIIDISTVVSMETEVERTVGSGPTMQFIPRQGQLERAYEKLQKLPNMKVYKKEDIPLVWHYRDNSRILPILAVANEGWLIVKDASRISSTNKGNHGYDNRLMSMKPIFYARGPNIKKNFTSKPFLSLDIYPMICAILNITPAPNNGSLTRVQEFLLPSSDGHRNTTEGFLELGGHHNAAACAIINTILISLIALFLFIIL